MASVVVAAKEAEESSALLVTCEGSPSDSARARLARHRTFLGSGRLGNSTKLAASLTVLLLAGVGAATMLVASMRSQNHSYIPTAAAYAPTSLQEILPFDQWASTFKVQDAHSELANITYHAYAHHPVFLQEQASMSGFVQWQISHHCPKQVDGVSFQSMSSFEPLPNVPKAYHCQKACTETPGCVSFSWGSQAAKETGLTHVCFRKSKAEGATQKVPAEGVVSGLPCDRQGRGFWWPWDDSQYYDLPMPPKPVYAHAELEALTTLTTTTMTTTVTSTTTTTTMMSAAIIMPPALTTPPLNAIQPASTTQPINMIQPPSTMEHANTITPLLDSTRPASTTQPINTMQPPSAMEPVNTTKPAIMIEPVGTVQTTGTRSAAQASNVTALQQLTQPVTAAQHQSTTEFKTEVPAPGKSTMLCIALFIVDTYEQDLLVTQYNMNASLFQCDKYAVYSSQVVEIAPGLVSRRIASTQLAEIGGRFITVLNLGVFLTLWRQVILDADFMKTDWTLKLDPDTVFFAWRLRPILDGLRPAIAEHSSKYGGDGVYLNNCGQGLHGPVEVFSQDAVRAFVTHAKQCSWGLNGGLCKDAWSCAVVWNVSFRAHCNGPCTKWWGEDIWVDQCLSRWTKAKRVFVPELLVEDHCYPPLGWRYCNDTKAAAFHPFKKLDEYTDCWEQAQEYEKTKSSLAPLTMP